MKPELKAIFHGNIEFIISPNYEPYAAPSTFNHFELFSHYIILPSIMELTV